VADGLLQELGFSPSADAEVSPQVESALRALDQIAGKR
jgi:hypothetical protein